MQVSFCAQPRLEKYFFKLELDVVGVFYEESMMRDAADEIERRRNLDIQQLRDYLLFDFCLQVKILEMRLCCGVFDWGFMSSLSRVSSTTLVGTREYQESWITKITIKKIRITFLRDFIVFLNFLDPIHVCTWNFTFSTWRKIQISVVFTHIIKFPKVPHRERENSQSDALDCAKHKYKLCNFVFAFVAEIQFDAYWKYTLDKQQERFSNFFCLRARKDFITTKPRSQLFARAGSTKETRWLLRGITFMSYPVKVNNFVLSLPKTTQTSHPRVDVDERQKIPLLCFRSGAILTCVSFTL